MTFFARRHPAAASAGCSLLEVLIVLALMGALTAIALPYYLAYTRRAQASACLANRRNIEVTEYAHFVRTQTVNLTVAGAFRCPAGGEYVWIRNDPADPGYPLIGCSVHGWQAPSTAGDGPPPLFASTFDAMTDLVPLLGNWETTAEGIRPANPGEHRLAFGDPQWTDYTLTLNATLESGPGYGIYFRADGEKQISGYAFQYDPGYGSGEFLVRKVIDGKEQSPFQRARFPEGYAVYNQAREISITTRGTATTIRVDGAVVFEFEDDAFASGMAGLRTWSNTSAVFHEVQVSTPAGSTP
jgi:type II secretory pathway pseudopilin PulG